MEPKETRSGFPPLHLWGVLIYHGLMYFEVRSVSTSISAAIGAEVNLLSARSFEVH
jgi:hypothetical protein